MNGRWQIFLPGPWEITHNQPSISLSLTPIIWLERDKQEPGFLTLHLEEDYLPALAYDLTNKFYCVIRLCSCRLRGQDYLDKRFISGTVVVTGSWGSQKNRLKMKQQSLVTFPRTHGLWWRWQSNVTTFNKLFCENQCILHQQSSFNWDFPPFFTVLFWTKTIT